MFHLNSNFVRLNVLLYVHSLFKIICRLDNKMFYLNSNFVRLSMLLYVPPLVDCCFVPLAYFSRMGIFFLLMLKGDLNFKDFLLIFVIKKMFPAL